MAPTTALIEQNRQILSRHYKMRVLTGEHYRITDIIAYIKSLDKNTRRALQLFKNEVGSNFELNHYMTSGVFYDIRFERVASRVNTGPVQHDRFFLSNEGKLMSYHYFFMITRMDGSRATELFSAIDWHFSYVEPLAKKRRGVFNETSKRKCVYGGYRHPLTTQERRYAAMHCEEYGEGIVRPARRANALPNVWDDIRAHAERSWKCQSKKRKQWM